jgi:hypothetical protein
MLRQGSPYGNNIKSVNTLLYLVNRLAIPLLAAEIFKDWIKLDLMLLPSWRLSEACLILFWAKGAEVFLWVAGAIGNN